MSKIISKLDLNKNPQLADNGSLVFAKNIKVLKDGSIAPDSAIDIAVVCPYIILGYIIGINQTIYLFVEKEESKYGIYEYNEVTSELKEIDCNWNYGGGIIHGVCTTNNTNEIILTICEYFEDNTTETLVPIKHINISKSKKEDDESTYTQTPNIPITNLLLTGTYNNVIPNGVYQFFIRYKIRKNFYTNWFPCSKECFTGNSNIINTVQGSVKYVDTSRDSNLSFIFSVEHLFEKYKDLYEEFQIGFIVSHDDSIQARSWKHFNFTVEEIYFDYDNNFIQEINIDDLLKANYQLYNIKNIIYYRGKEYISNYIESNFNKPFEEYADAIECNIKQASEPLYQKDFDVFFGEQQLSLLENSNFNLYNIQDLFIDYRSYFPNSDDSTKSDAGVIYTFYAKWYKELDADVYFISSGYSQVFTNENNVSNILLPSFNLTRSNDTNDIETSLFYDVLSDTPENSKRIILGLREYVGRVKYALNKAGHPLSSKLPSPTTEKSWAYGAGEKSETNEINAVPIYKYVDNADPLPQGLTEDDLQDIYDYDKITNLDSCTNGLSNLILSYIKEHYPYIVIRRIAFKSYNKTINIYNATNKSTKDITIESVTKTITSDYYNDYRGISNLDVSITRAEENSEVIDLAYRQIFISYTFVGVDTNGTIYAKPINSEEVIPITQILIDYVTLDYTCDADDAEIDDGTEIYSAKVDVKAVPTIHQIRINPALLLKVDDKSTYNTTSNNNTLVPFSDYEFYIHYIKQNGVTTNGYKINNITGLEEFDLTKGVIYPKFNNITIPENYVAYFISTRKINSDIMMCFNHRIIDDYHVVDCIEIDALLYPLIDNITIIDITGKVVTDKAVYYPSSSTNPPYMLGNVGCIKWLKKDNESANNNVQYFVKIEKTNNNYNLPNLIKLTPYLTESSYADYENLNSPGYWANICKPIDSDVNITKNGVDIYGHLYVNGSDAYIKDVNERNLIKLETYNDDLALINTTTHNNSVIFSNYNIKYLALTNPITPKLRTYALTDYAQKEIDKKKQMLYMLDSSTISYIYTLPDMYKTYTRRFYTAIQDNNITKYENTIRESDINTDEVFRNIYKFDATDYHNVPTNKGKIVNMFTIKQDIFVHCEHTLFKFSGNDTLSSANNEVKLTESDIFDKGIAEVFDSQYGFAGLQHKKQSLITFEAYIFYDSVANIIYGYFGDNNIVNISQSINKILSNKYIKDILFVSDVTNDRFFTNIKFDDSNICLSFNFRNKSFTSIHDIDFTDAFATRTNCYFLNENKNNLYKIDDLQKTTNYSSLTKQSKLFIADTASAEESLENCVDIIFNENFEYIKVLNYINWICSEIKKYVEDNNLYLADEDIVKYPGTKIRIYSDQCSTELINLADEENNSLIQNNENLDTFGNYEYPRYNCGIWSLNYFRDIRNNDNVNSDKSLIYGKYFVVRFIFKDVNFRLENININTQNYEKV